MSSITRDVATGFDVGEREARAVDPLLSQDMSPELRAKMLEELRKGAEEKAKKATYKIQLVFKSNRSSTKDMAWTLSFWESGKRLHGGGDEMMFVCRRQRAAPRVKPPIEAVTLSGRKVEVTPAGCDHLIPGALVQCGMVVCPHCLTKHQTDQIADSLYYYGNVQKCAESLEFWFRRLGSDADIVVKYRPDDPRTLVMSRSYGIAKAKQLKGMTVYPLERIIKDTSAGASVLDRFRALILA